jgi:hypothetical protein
MQVFSEKKHMVLSLFLGTFLLFPGISYVRWLLNDYNYPPLTSTVRYTAIAIFAVSFIFYFLFLRRERSRSANLKFFQYFILFFFSGIFLSCIYPIFSIDLFEYIIRGRILGVYGANPYIHAPVNFPQDVLYDIVFWKGQPMIYGPVWAYLVTAASIVAKESIFFSQFFVKLILLVFHIVLTYSIFVISGDVGVEDRKVITLSYLFNPYVLVMVLVDGHMDTVMMCFLMLSVWTLYRKNNYLSFFFLVLSILTKYFTVIFVPFYLVYIWDQRKNNVTYIRTIFVSFVLMSATAIALYGPLWGGLETFAALRIVGTGFDTNTFPYVTYSLMTFFLVDISEKFFRYMSYLSFIMVYLYIFVSFVRSDNKRKFILSSMFWIFAAYILLASFQLGAWYFMWIIPFLLLMDIPSKHILSGMISFAALISFWKRVSFLMIAVLFLYAIIVMVKKNRRKLCIGS